MSASPFELEACLSVERYGRRVGAKHFEFEPADAELGGVQENGVEQRAPYTSTAVSGNDAHAEHSPMSKSGACHPLHVGPTDDGPLRERDHAHAVAGARKGADRVERRRLERRDVATLARYAIDGFARSFGICATYGRMTIPIATRASLHARGLAADFCCRLPNSGRARARWECASRDLAGSGIGMRCWRFPRRQFYRFAVRQVGFARALPSWPPGAERTKANGRSE